MNVVAPAGLREPDAAPRDIRVLVVDDAIVVRYLVAQWIEETPGLKLAATVRNGREALDRFDRADPDVVVLDVEMPELDGIATLRHLLKRRRDLVVIMVSALTRHNAEVTLKALALGAADYIPKPETKGGVMTSASFRRELIEKVLALGARRRSPTALRLAARLAPTPPVPPARVVERVRPRQASIAEPTGQGVFTLRPFAATIPRVLLVGASTGGPQALIQLISGLNAVRDNAPILITQHMPATFTTILAEHLSRAGGKPVAEAVDGEPVLAGRTYLAPGGRHMLVAGGDGAPRIVLDDGPPVKFCKPAVDPLFSTAAQVWGAGVLALILTGMGNDGTAGAADIVAAGGSVIAQDEATSVVWGMPGGAVAAGLCSTVLPIEDIAPKVVGLMRGTRP